MTQTFPDLSLPDMRKRDGLVQSLGDFANVWTMADYAAVWRYRYCDLNEAPADITCLTLTREDRNWQRVFGFEKLHELHLYEASADQLIGLSKLTNLTALSISHSRPKDLSPLAGLSRLRELSLDYVSGLSSLKPLGQLPKLAALDCNNLRGVSDFSGLSGSPSLRFLRIGSTAELG